MFNREQHFGYEKNSNRRKILRKAANNSPLLNKTGEKMGCIRRTIPLRRTKEKHFFSFEFMLQKNTDAKDTDFEASVEPVFFKRLLRKDWFWKSSSQSFSSFFEEVFFMLSQNDTVEALVKSVLKKHLLGQDF